MGAADEPKVSLWELAENRRRIENVGESFTLEANAGCCLGNLQVPTINKPDEPARMMLAGGGDCG
jgi:hypothetical protein